MRVGKIVIIRSSVRLPSRPFGASSTGRPEHDAAGDTGRRTLRACVPPIPPTSANAARSRSRSRGWQLSNGERSKRFGDRRHEHGQATNPSVWMIRRAGRETLCRASRAWIGHGFSIFPFAGRAGLPCRRHPLGCVRFGPGVVLRERVGPRHARARERAVRGSGPARERAFLSGRLCLAKENRTRGGGHRHNAGGTSRAEKGSRS
jgi:hypothetical protein